MFIPTPTNWVEVDRTVFWSLLDSVNWTMNGFGYCEVRGFNHYPGVALITDDPVRFLVNPEFFRPIPGPMQSK